MKKVLYLISVSILASLLVVSCAQTTQQAKTDVKQETTTKVKADAGDGGDMAVRAINKQVEDFAIDGFPGGSAKLSSNEDLENMKKIVGLVKPIIESVPAGYTMQITGHAANYDSASRQKSVSTARAAKIYSELKKAGVPASKMSYKGVGIAEPISGYSDKDAKQRSVSFKAVKK